jgi:hypothetical protein
MFIKLITKFENLSKLNLLIIIYGYIKKFHNVNIILLLTVMLLLILK